ncbi:hypothetical protein B0O99DRAFT_668142 [Bisporella sp. PMI_857]|nr:hypothetical protein B0O99DRAFT_668142 [Bisporella sp. PMI_857]
MATFRDSIDELHNEVMHDISYFEQYELPASPPETPPMKQEAKMALRGRTPMHAAIEKVLPRSPPESPRMALKRTFSNNVKSTFGLPMTPPDTPPMNRSQVGIHPTLAKTLSDSVNKSLGHQISYFNLKNRPTIVTIDVTEIPRRGTLSRSSSYSLSSAGSVSSGSKDPLDRVKDYTTRSTDTIFPSPNMLAPPVYSPPPNTPATFEPIYHNYSDGADFATGVAQFGNGSDPFNPFAYTGPTQPENSPISPVLARSRRQAEASPTSRRHEVIASRIVRRRSGTVALRR